MLPGKYMHPTAKLLQKCVLPGNSDVGDRPAWITGGGIPKRLNIAC
jgi:hypothetical protein